MELGIYDLQTKLNKCIKQLLSRKQSRCVKAFNTFVRDNIEDVDSRSGYLNQLLLLTFRVLNTVTHSLRSPLSSQRSPTTSPATAPPAPAHLYIDTHNLSHIVTLASPLIELDPSPTHSAPPPPPVDSTSQQPRPQTRTGTGTAERLNQVAEQNTMMMGQSKGRCPKKQSQSEAT
jgi:hypothetical protein